MILVYPAFLSAYVYTYVALHIRRCLKWELLIVDCYQNNCRKQKKCHVFPGIKVL